MSELVFLGCVNLLFSGAALAFLIRLEHRLTKLETEVAILLAGK